MSITEENLNIKDEEDGLGCDHDEPDGPGEPDEHRDEEEMLFAEPGQESQLGTFCKGNTQKMRKLGDTEAPGATEGHRESIRLCNDRSQCYKAGYTGKILRCWIEECNYY